MGCGDWEAASKACHIKIKDRQINDQTAGAKERSTEIYRERETNREL